MAYNEALAKRLEKALEPFKDDVIAKKMFGGMCYMYKGKMSVGIVKDSLCVRVIAAKMDNAMKQEHVRPMDFTGKPLKEFIYVAPEGFETEEALNHWVELGIEHAESKTK